MRSTIGSLSAGGTRKLARKSVSRLFALAMTLFGAACGSSGGGATSPRACLRSLDDYCRGAAPPCVRHVDPARAVESFCQQLTLASTVTLEPLDCSEAGWGIGVPVGGAGSVFVTRLYRYDKATGQLVAVSDSVTDESVISFGSCVAGSSASPGTVCTDWQLPYVCSPGASSDAAQE
jgi:hypothetical protein